MSKKIVFVILWLTFSFSLLAQVPKRTKPATPSSQETKPCWEQEVKTMADGARCFDFFIEELSKQKDNRDALEELELSGVRFLKANGYSDEVAARMVADQIKKLEVLELSASVVPEEVKPTSLAVPKPIPTTSVTIPKETSEQEQIRNLEEQLALLQKLGARDKIINLRADIFKLQQNVKKEEKLRRKEESRFERRARKEMEKREKAERKTEENFALAWLNAKPRCRGSQSPNAVKIFSTGHFNYNRWQAFNMVFVTNWQPFPVTITAVDANKGGEVVELPSGCSVTLARSIIPGVENVAYGVGVTFYYTAIASNPNHHQKEFRSQSFYLRSGNSSPQQDSSRWNIGQQPVEYSSSY